MYRDVQPLECRVLSTEWVGPLMDFLRDLSEAGDSELFCPHAFTDAAVRQIISRTHKDTYYVLLEGKRVLGYGMLRGWDEGFEIPSLGIAIHPAVRGVGLGNVFMGILHASARRRGAEKVRLRVKRENIRAAKLYEHLGYKFEHEEAGYLVGFLELGRVY